MSKILQELNGVAEYDYAVFNKKIANTNKTVLGVRMPYLRKMASRLDYSEVENEDANIYEIAMLQGLTFAKRSYEDIKNLISAVVKDFDSWAFIDSVVPSCKDLKTNIDKAIDELFSLCTDGEFFRRFYIVAVMNFCPLDSKAMQNVKKMENSEYYVTMAIAWYISVIFTLDFNEGVGYMKSFSPAVQKMAIRKGLDSYRLSKEQKSYLKSLKI